MIEGSALNKGSIHRGRYYNIVGNSRRQSQVKFEICTMKDLLRTTSEIVKSNLKALQSLQLLMEDCPGSKIEKYLKMLENDMEYKQIYLFILVVVLECVGRLEISIFNMKL